jgi:TonB family protein
MATATTGKVVKGTDDAMPFALMEHKGIFARLVEELSLAAKNFSQDPRAFVKDLFFDESKDLQRKKLIRTGLTLAVIFHIAAGIFLATVKWNRNPLIAKNGSDEELILKGWVPPEKHDAEKPPDESIPKNSAKGSKEGLSGGEKTAAASGGGQGDTKPASLGTPPPMAKIPPIVAMKAPEGGPQATLPTPVTIQGNIDAPPLPPGTVVGSPTGTGNTPSGGTGSGTGIGDSKGPGVGNNSGPGAGSDKGGEKPGAGGTGGTPDGSAIPSAIPYVQLAKYPSSGIVWIKRVRPIVTSEAQDSKVYGYVLLEATFNADGTITDIVVRQHLQGMDGAAIDALQRAKFRPATIKGQPITLYKVPIKVPVNLEASS